jgi:hypothetical protein
VAQPGMPGSQFPGEDAQGRKIKDLERQMQQFAAANVLATAGISAATGGVLVNGFMEYKREDGTRGVRVDPVTGAFTAYDATGLSEVARFGALTETAPGEYGVEVLVGGTWVQLGAQASTWDLVAGKPADFAPLVTTAVANATHAATATEAVHAAQADGSEYGWTNNVAGTSFYALWVGNDGGFHLGRNVSSIRYKENVTDAAVTPEDVLALRPVKYDRKPTFKYPEDDDGNRLIGPEQKFAGATDQFGLIAEEVAAVVPELTTYFGGEIDGVNYELLGVALLPVVKQQAADIAALKQAVRELGGNI